MSAETKKEASPAGSSARQLTRDEMPVPGTHPTLLNQSVEDVEPAPPAQSALTSTSESWPGETKTSAAVSESIRQKLQVPGVRPGFNQDFLKRPPMIQVERAREIPAAQERSAVSAQTPVPMLKRPPRVVTERQAQSERAARKPLLEEKASASHTIQPKVHPTVDRVIEDQSREARIASSSQSLHEARPPSQQNMVTASLTTHSAAPARRPELPDGSSRPARQGPGPEKKPEGPRLNIGRLEIQIIQENAPAVNASRDGGRDGSKDLWEQMDRRHLRRAGGA
jgi:hypothetical protein